jgi:hypothetical protein
VAAVGAGAIRDQGSAEVLADGDDPVLTVSARVVLLGHRAAASESVV